LQYVAATAEQVEDLHPVAVRNANRHTNADGYTYS
jgi:hypothetical protein